MTKFRRNLQEYKIKTHVDRTKYNRKEKHPMTNFNPSAKESKPSFDLIPEGPHPARCARIIELGEQESQYGVQTKVVIAFNVTDSFITLADGTQKQRMISNPFGINMSNNEKSTMAQYTKALNPKATSLEDFLGRACQVSVVHYKKDDQVRDRLDAVAPIIPGLQIPELDITPWWFRWEAPDADLWAQIPEFTQNLIKKAVNYKGSLVEEMVESMTASTPY